VLLGLNFEYSRASTVTVVSINFIHILANEFSGELRAHIARVSERMTHGLVSMRQTVINALANNAAEIAEDCGRNVFTHDISTKRQWQAGFAFPPLAKIDNLFKTGLLICELSFVND